MKRIIRRTSKKSGDSWQVIYMDLMTMVMVFFVILWSLNQSTDKGVSETVGDVSTRMVHLPGDVLYSPGRAAMTPGGVDIIKKLFGSKDGGVISFDSNDLVKRMLVIHGHTDSDGTKDQNLDLGYKRALAAFREINKHSKGLEDNIVICTHADNSPVADVPKFPASKKLSAQQRQVLRDAKKKNRRITVEDKIINQFKVEK